jgi:hypothetical protein
MRPSTRAATRERMVSIMAKIMFVLVITVGFLVPQAAAQSDKYSKMAGRNQHAGLGFADC